MNCQQPSHSTLYATLCARDDRFENQIWVGVTSTGIFCRLTCPARNPKPENCQFYDSIKACIDAGFRPCKRCRPMATMADVDPIIATCLAALDATPAHRFTEADLQALGCDPSTVRRSFKRSFGMTFLEMARHRRLREGFTTLAKGGSVIEAQLNAGFDSPSAFRSAFAKLLGQSPRHFKSEAQLRADWLETPLGPMIAVCDTTSLHLLEFLDRKALPGFLQRLHHFADGSLGIGTLPLHDRLRAQLERYFSGISADFDLPLTLHGSAFTQNHWRRLQKIPVGQTETYGALARALGNPGATRAIARANGANQIELVIPCHRVIGSDGSLTGYGGGLWRKKRLLDLEREMTKERRDDPDTRPKGQSVS